MWVGVWSLSVQQRAPLATLNRAAGEPSTSGAIGAPRYGRLRKRMRRRIQPIEPRDASEAEHTEVRARHAEDPSRGLQGLEAKLERARVAFLQLSDDDSRARLLQVAMLRRDEVLLDALLRRLEPGRSDPG